ncbi:MAG TPA: preprotein translocase subunit YajC [Bacteroidetes bacterium]|jgi:preprotein translocase subunit YajC|nr:preprotein translocase subunit YajC [Bacteroidota bacterium]
MEMTTMLLFYAAFIVILYFFFILPNKKKQKALKQFITDLKKGDKVVTTGGLHGKIVELKELTAIIDAGNNIKLKINRAAISMEASMLLSNDVSED